MESSPLWDQPNLLWIGLACLVSFLGLSLLINGWSMKVACRICGVDEISFRFGLLIAVVSGSAGIATSLAVAFTVSEPSAGLAALAPAVAMIGTIALLVGRNPFRAFGIYVLHSIIGTLLTLAVCAPLAVAAAFLIPTETMEQLAAAATESVEEAPLLANLTSAAGKPEPAAAPAVAATPSQPLDSVRETPSEKPSRPAMRSVLPDGVEQNPFVK